MSLAISTPMSFPPISNTRRLGISWNMSISILCTLASCKIKYSSACTCPIDPLVDLVQRMFVMSAYFKLPSLSMKQNWKFAIIEFERNAVFLRDMASNWLPKLNLIDWLQSLFAFKLKNTSSIVGPARWFIPFIDNVFRRRCARSCIQNFVKVRDPRDPMMAFSSRCMCSNIGSVVRGLPLIYSMLFRLRSRRFSVKPIELFPKRSSMLRAVSGLYLECTSNKTRVWKWELSIPANTWA